MPRVQQQNLGQYSGNIGGVPVEPIYDMQNWFRMEPMTRTAAGPLPLGAVQANSPPPGYIMIDALYCPPGSSDGASGTCYPTRVAIPDPFAAVYGGGGYTPALPPPVPITNTPVYTPAPPPAPVAVAAPAPAPVAAPISPAPSAPRPTGGAVTSGTGIPTVGSPLMGDPEILPVSDGSGAAEPAKVPWGLILAAGALLAGQ